MPEIATFWDNTHPLCEANDRLFDQLIPEDGPASTLQGELLRASTKISYDWVNNGWGCNNWSGAVVFLKKFFKDLPVQPDINIHMNLLGALSYAEEYSHGEPSPRNEARADQVVTTIHEIVVQAVLDNPEPIANNRDMYDFSEEDYRHRCADEDGEYGYY